ncbi:hypothetical protein F511_45569 [Dorcoceras hygrometricum]|uniref:Uncharacterized protein n=1 Tax=Dorcoceras hygrometricum TaxID=472368 RepID=A0A2Z6ZVK6_9LAMI|nr:hypothetical protein F511_45569 [Dorcoceras hygrometricum]
MIKQTQIYDIHRAFNGIPCWQLVPGSDQFLEETGTSRLIVVDYINPVHDQKRDSFVSLH